MIDVMNDGGDQADHFIHAVAHLLDRLLLQEAGGGVQDVGRVGGVVVSIGPFVVGFNECQPVLQDFFRAAQGFVQLEASENGHT